MRSGFTLPGDVSASRRYWNEDIIEPAAEVTPRGTINVRQPPEIKLDPDCGLPFGLVGRDDDASRVCVIPNQLHVYGLRDAAEETFAFSKNYRTGEQHKSVDEIPFEQLRIQWLLRTRISRSSGR